MDEGIKRKLVGAGVLVTVAIVVLPMITPRAQNAAYLSKSVPLEPNIPNMSMPLPKSLSINTRDLKGEDVKPEAIVMNDIVVDGDKLTPKNIEVPVVDKSGQSKVWHIQVGSFADPKNAISLRNKLRKAGYKAFDKAADDGRHTRVFVGPSTQRANLEGQLSKINRAFKVEGQLVPYLGR